MEYTIEDIKKALIPVIGNGEATKKILESFTPNDKEIEINHIITRGVVQFRVLQIKDTTFKCKSWDGNMGELLKSEVSLASDTERMQYYKNQVEFLRTNIAPFLNFFSMRILNGQVKEETAKETLDRQLNNIEQDCFGKLQDIKKLW
jgi:hypothetical protein